MRKILLINLFLFLTPTIAFAININIPDDQPNIQSGIDAAIHGDTILIADGTYTGNGNYNIDFKGKAITVKLRMVLREKTAAECMLKVPFPL